jgi:hypothetical protein
MTIGPPGTYYVGTPIATSYAAGLAPPRPQFRTLSSISFNSEVMRSWNVIVGPGQAPLAIRMDTS